MNKPYPPLERLHHLKLQDIQAKKNRIDEFRQELTTLEAQNSHKHAARINELRHLIHQIDTNEIETGYWLSYVSFIRKYQAITNEHQSRVADIHREHTTDNNTTQHMLMATQQLQQNLDSLVRDFIETFRVSDRDSAELGSHTPTPGDIVSTETSADEPKYHRPRHKCTYRRINHLREFLRQQQGKTRVVVHPDVIEAVRAEMVKHHLDPSQSNQTLVRYILKKLNQSVSKRHQCMGGRLKQSKPSNSWSRYYECAANIANILNPDFKPMDIPPEREQIICTLFEQAEMPFMKIRNSVKPGRKNFLSYPYIIYKICELLAFDEYLSHFELLKSDALLIMQDKWWKEVCRKLDWQFIPTVGRIDFISTTSIDQ